MSYPLLHEVLLDPRADPRVLDFALEQALLLKGPKVVFGDLQQDAKKFPQLFSAGPRASMLDRSHHRHVWIGQSLFINLKDMSVAAAHDLFQKMISDVKHGESLDDVYARYDGPNYSGRIGNYGDWVLSVAKHDGKPFRFITIQDSHVKQLLNSKPGDLLILDDDRTGEPYVVLYQVREIYSED